MTRTKIRPKEAGLKRRESTLTTDQAEKEKQKCER